MRCTQCHFENIPGQARCVRCHSILEVGAMAVEVYPPRMPVWTRPFRGLTRWLRGHRALPERLSPESVRGRLSRVRSDPLTGLALSVVPGLGHLIQGRFKEAALWVLAWLALMAAAVFCYGGNVGFLLLGLALGVHAWIAVQSGLWAKATALTERVMTVLGVMAVLALLYWGMPRLVFRGYTGVHSVLTIPAMKIRAGDYLLVRRRAHESTMLPRGSLVLVHPTRLWNMRQDLFNNPRTVTLGQVIGLPLEVVEIQNGGYVVGGRRLDPQKFPVPRWLRGWKYSIHLPADSYFVSLEYQMAGHGYGAVPKDAITEVSTFSRDDIRGRAFLRWWPLPRQRLIE